MSKDETAANTVAHKKELTEKQAQSLKISDDMRRVWANTTGDP